MQLNINLAQETSPDDLPNQTQNQVFLDLDDVSTANVHHRATNTLCRLNYDVVVLGHVEGVQSLDLLADSVEDTFVDGVRYAVVDELGQDQTVLAVVEHLKGVGVERQQAANIGVAGKNSIDVPCELGQLILVDGMLRAASRATNSDPAASCVSANAGLRSVRGCAGRAVAWLRSGTANASGPLRPGGHALLGWRGLPQLGNEIDIVVELYATRGVKFDLFQRLADDIVGLALGVLGGLDDGRFVEVAAVFDIEFAESVGEREDLLLLELGILPMRASLARAFRQV